MAHKATIIASYLALFSLMLVLLLLDMGTATDVMASTVLLVVFITIAVVNHGVFKRGPINVGSVSRHGDSRAFRGLRYILGLEFRQCGCLYVDYSSVSSRAPDVEVLESDSIYIAIDLGAKWKYHPGREETVRCVACGNSYLRVRESSGRVVSRWKDDLEPAPDDCPIVEEEVLG